MGIDLHRFFEIGLGLGQQHLGFGFVGLVVLEPAPVAEIPPQLQCIGIPGIAGQRPLITKAKKSIAGFKLREGMPIGCKVTLRGARMWEFLDRLTSVALPRIRDFRGLDPASFDGRGNYSLGVREQIIFPEIDYDRIDTVRGLDVTITTTANTDEEARELLRALGMPFREA